MERYYHLYTSPLKGSLLFYDDSDRRFFLNRLSILLPDYNICVYVYCLMDNHVHFLISGVKDDVENLFLEMARIYARYFRESSRKLAPNSFKPGMRLIESENDFKIVTSYILRNPLAAGIAAPDCYKWSSCFLYFNPWLSSLRKELVKEYGTMKFRAENSTRVVLPDSITLIDGIINPARWCGYKKVEKIFGTSMDFFKMLGRWTIENEENSAIDGIEKNGYPDSQLLAKVADYCAESGADSTSSLSSIDMRRLISVAHRRWGASKQQIARVIGASDDIIERYY